MFTRKETMGFVAFVCVVAFLDFTTSAKLDIAENLVFPKINAKNNTCLDLDAQTQANEFHNCFVDKKYKDGGSDLENIVDRILEHSRVCAGNLTRTCRPSYKGFVTVMDKIISQMKDYCFMYLELITAGRDKIKDLQCVETSLSNETYQNCFQDTFVGDTNSPEFQQKVEKAISCTNKENKQCSRAAKTSLNRMVRTILGVKQPAREDIVEEEEVKPQPQPAWRWYDYIIQPLVSMWRSIRSFFGF